MRGGLLLLMVFASAALAQGEEFTLPAFEEQGDAGVPSAPPLPPLVPDAGPPRPPPAPAWARLGGSTSVIFTALSDYYLGADVTLLATVAGVPAPSDHEPGEVEGFLLQLGGEILYGHVGGPRCGGSALCAQRVSGGLAVKTGWARGLPSVREGLARTQTMYFAQLDVLLSNYDIESAPLSPGVKSWELITRLRLGLHFTSAASRVTFTGVTLMGAAIVEVIPLSSVTRGLSIGACLGIGF